MLSWLDFIRNDREHGLDRLEITNKAIIHQHPEAKNLNKEILDLSRYEMELRALIKNDPMGLIINYTDAVQQMKELYNYIVTEQKKYSVATPKQANPEFQAQRAQMEKIAHNIVTRWVNRKLLEIFPGRKGIIILHAVKFLHDSIHALNDMMDLIETRSPDPASVMKSYEDFTSSLKEVCMRLASLGKMYINEQKTLSKFDKGLALQLTNVRALEQASRKL